MKPNVKNRCNVGSLHDQKIKLLFEAVFKRQQSGQLEAAFLVSKEICKMDPENAAAFQLSGVLACQLKEYVVSLNLLSTAISLKPDSAEAFFNRGRVLMEIEYCEEALNDYSQAISRNPKYLEALNNRGLVFKRLQRFTEAVNDFKIILSIDQSNESIWRNLGNLLKNLHAQSSDPDLMGLIVILLEKRTFVRPKSMLRCGISLLKLHPAFKNILEKSVALEKGQITQSSIIELSKIPLLLTFMELCPISDLGIEVLLKKARTFILLNFPNLQKNQDLLRFQNALALQCFTNEYVYEVSEKELKALNNIEKSIKDKVASGSKIDPFEMACFAAYKSLQDYPWRAQLAKMIDLEKVFIRQVMEPLEENNSKSKIPFISRVENSTSIKVRKQYEQNPYPRWVDLELYLGSQSIPLMINNLNLKVSGETINPIEKPRILVAGCGTGQHSIETASKFKEASLVAIDISVSSLAYAKRKTQELNIQNIKYIHCDILNTESLEQQFDIIESVGVLHHMDNPMEGWRALVNCLKPKGLMRIGLYSKIARTEIQAIRDENKHIKRTLDEGSTRSIKMMRARLINSGKIANKQIMKIDDFYSLSSFRDLVLHVQEHQFTIPMIKNSLTELGLMFIGFENANIIHKFKTEYSKLESLYNLDDWDSFEEKNPKTFIGMYEFWCQKIS